MPIVGGLDIHRKQITSGYLAASVVASLHPDGGSAFHQHYQASGLTPSRAP